jgi:hypothetical protein
VSKKGRKRRGSFPYYQKIWRDALSDLRDELVDHCLKATPDQLQFQTGRLFKNLKRRIETAGRDRLKTMTLCYRFVTDRSLDLGYDEPRRLHFEEMDALRAEQPISKGKGYRPLTPAQQEIADRLIRGRLSKLKRHLESKPGKESIVLMLLRSIAWWMEAQESFSMWLSFRHHRAGWRGDLDQRARAIQASILATALTRLYVYEYKGRQTRGVRLWEGLGVGTNYKGDVWNQRQWANILGQAARLAEKGEADCTALERWLWWCYPVFRRYGWNIREVQQAAKTRGFTPAEEMYEANFRRYLLTRGIAVRGRRTKRESPPLAEFVQELEPPVSAAVRGLPIWF